MKISFKKNIKKKSKRASFFSFGKNPYKDWKILVGISFLMIICVISFGAYIFFGIRSGDLFAVPVKEVAPRAALDQKFLEDVLNRFQNKAEKFAELKEKGAGIPIPDR